MQVEGHKNDPLPGQGWAGFLRKTALSLACVLLASAVICWVAANWAHASVFQKLAGAQLVLAALVFMTWRLVYVSGADKGQNFSLSANMAGLAAVATGALLALVGQIYQTGADPWELFLLWAVLLLPWLLVMRSVFLAMLCAVLLNVAMALYLGVYGISAWLGSSSWMAQSVLLVMLNLALLVLWEYGIAWLDDRWRIGPRILGAGALAWLAAAAVAGLDSSTGVWAIVAPGLLVMALMYWVYTRKRFDLAMVCLAALGAFGLVMVALIGWLDSEEGLLLAIVALVILAGLMLRHLRTLIRPKEPAPGQGQPGVNLLDEPWFLSLFRLAVMGITACLLIAFLFMVLDLRSERVWQLGIVVGASGLLVFRASRSIVLHELGTTLMAAGLLLTGVGLFFMDGISPDIRAAGMLLTAVVLYVFGAGAAVRFLCAFFGLAVMLALTWPGHDMYALFDTLDHSRIDGAVFPAYLRLWWLAVAAVLALTVGVQRRDEAFWAPLAWALVCLTQLMAWLAPAPALYGLAALWQQVPGLLLIWLACAVLPVLILAAVLWQARDLPKLVRYGAPVALAVASLGWMGVPGIAMALVWLILGYARARRSLLVFGVFALLAYLSRYYYQMDSTLLHKSWVLGLTGAWLLLSWYVLHMAVSRSAGPGPGWRSNSRPARWFSRQVGLLTGLVLVLLVVNTGIYQREQILATGQRVVLALAPVDPRSLMQGDYMVLRFAVADQFRQKLAQTPAVLAEKIENRRGGYLVLQPDEQGVYQLAALTDNTGGQPGAQAAVLEFRLRNDKLRIVTDAWFFPEGQAARFEQARYGDFRVDSKGRGLLTQLLDKQLRPLP